APGRGRGRGRRGVRRGVGGWPAFYKEVREGMDFNARTPRREEAQGAGSWKVFAAFATPRLCVENSFLKIRRSAALRSERVDRLEEGAGEGHVSGLVAVNAVPGERGGGDVREQSVAHRLGVDGEGVVFRRAFAHGESVGVDRPAHGLVAMVVDDEGGGEDEALDQRAGAGEQLVEGGGEFLDKLGSAYW